MNGSDTKYLFSAMHYWTSRLRSPRFMNGLELGLAVLPFTVHTLTGWLVRMSLIGCSCGSVGGDYPTTVLVAGHLSV